MKLLTLLPVKRGNWYIKASIFDDQILIFIWNDAIMVYKWGIFFNENAAYNFVESITNVRSTGV